VAIRERFVADSPVEEDGSELPFPLRRGAFLNRLLPLLPAGRTSRNRGIRPERDRWFESFFLQRRVINELFRRPWALLVAG
jgi:hypothetical protein